MLFTPSAEEITFKTSPASRYRALTVERIAYCPIGWDEASKALRTRSASQMASSSPPALATRDQDERTRIRNVIDDFRRKFVAKLKAGYGTR